MLPKLNSTWEFDTTNEDAIPGKETMKVVEIYEETLGILPYGTYIRVKYPNGREMNCSVDEWNRIVKNWKQIS